jgi:hypothetical protein
MTDHMQYRTAQLNTPFCKTESKSRFNFKVAVAGISGGWLYLGVSRELFNYNVSCFYDIDDSFGFGMSINEICFESF